MAVQNVSQRRGFFRDASAIGVAAATGLVTQRAQGELAPDQPIIVGVMGLSRGRDLARQFARQPNVQVRYVCDADQQRVDACTAMLKADGHPAPEGIQDFRRMIDDQQLHALVCAAPNHWHAPATILACQADKHVYVEKPCSHNPWEGEAMVDVAHRRGKIVQLGTQRRSSSGTRLAIQRLHEGAIGDVYLARAWYNNLRGSIGVGKSAAIPRELDYELWQGPAPRRDYRDNVVHYNWHWRWHWGNGELGNNGIHSLDVCRWGLGVQHPIRVGSAGGRYAFDDDQETPDTQNVSFEFDHNRMISWDGLSCNRHGDGFVTFYGTEGTLALDGNGNFRRLDRNDRLQEEHLGSNGGEVDHISNFLAAIRANDRSLLNAEIFEGHCSTLLCHLGNISQRLQRSLQCDATSGRIIDDPDAMQFWQREYAAGWEPKV